MNICMIFPPLVNTNFGSYYPSTAYLAGYLSANGISSVQHDLNEVFAEYLLEDEVLGNITERNYAFLKDTPETALPIIAARILRRNKKELFTPDGRHLFKDDQSPLAYLLDHLSSSFRIDAELLSVDDEHLHDLRQFYEDFFDYANVVERIGSHSDLIGLSVPMGPQLFPAIFLAAYLKKKGIKQRIVAGGPAFSLMADADVEGVLRKEGTVDVIVKFDGEKPLLQLCKQVEAGIWVPELLPACHCLSGEAVVHNAPAEGLRLSELPFPEYEPQILSKLFDPDLGIIQARGCYWGKCSYCDFVELYEGSPKYRTKQVKDFVEELIYLNKKHSATRFSFITESLPPKFALTLSEEIIKRNLPFKWNSFAMVHNKFDAATFRKMREAGCEYLIIGIESMNSRVLKLVNKASNMEQNIEYISSAHEAGLPLRLNLIPDLPSTTYEEALFSLQQFEALQEKIDTVAIFPFEATRSSEVGRYPERFSLERHSGAATTNGQAQYANNHAKVVDKAMTPAQRAYVYQRYDEFANALNSRKLKIDEPAKAGSGHTVYRLPLQWYDFVPLDEQHAQFYTPLYRVAYKVPSSWVRAVETIQNRFPANEEQFYSGLSSLRSSELFDVLKVNRFIIPEEEMPAAAQYAMSEA